MKAQDKLNVMTPVGMSENITTASNSTLNRPFGHSVQPTSFRNFSDVNQRTFYCDDKSEEMDCPFDVAIEDIQEVDEKDDSPLKMTK